MRKLLLALTFLLASSFAWAHTGTLTWDHDGVNLTGFEIQVRRIVAGVPQAYIPEVEVPAADPPGGSYSAQTGDLVHGATYQWRARAHNGPVGGEDTAYSAWVMTGEHLIPQEGVSDPINFQFTGPVAFLFGTDVPLAGAVVGDELDIYVQWDGRDVQIVDFFCCKAPGIPHSPKVRDTEAPFTFTKVLTGIPTGTELELYMDVWFGDGPTRNVYTFFMKA